MRRGSYLWPYARAASVSNIPSKELQDSVLGFLAAGDYVSLRLMLKLAGVIE